MGNQTVIEKHYQSLGYCESLSLRPAPASHSQEERQPLMRLTRNRGGGRVKSKGSIGCINPPNVGDKILKFLKTEYKKRVLTK